MNEAAQTSSMEPADFPVPTPNKNADVIGVIGFTTAACEAIVDPEKKGACRELVEPLEEGNKDPIEVMVDFLMQNPEGVKEATDRFNFNMHKAMEIAEERMKAANAA